MLYCLRYLVALSRGVMGCPLLPPEAAHFLLFLSPGYGRMWAKGGETMEMKISCKCGSSFSVKGNCKNKSPFICQNCGKALPGEMSEHVLELLSVYKKLCDDIRSVELYEIEISDFKI